MTNPQTIKCECLKDQCKNGCVTGDHYIRPYMYDGQPRWCCRQCCPHAKYAILKEDLSGREPIF